MRSCLLTGINSSGSSRVAWDLPSGLRMATYVCLRADSADLILLAVLTGPLTSPSRLTYMAGFVATPQTKVVEMHHTVQSLFEEEEALLNLHMNIIQENAELLTEEGRLLQQIQGDDVIDYDIDAYATRLSEILDRKVTKPSAALPGLSAIGSVVCTPARFT